MCTGAEAAIIAAVISAGAGIGGTAMNMRQADQLREEQNENNKQAMLASEAALRREEERQAKLAEQQSDIFKNSLENANPNAIEADASARAAERKAAVDADATGYSAEALAGQATRDLGGSTNRIIAKELADRAKETRKQVDAEIELASMMPAMARAGSLLQQGNSRMATLGTLRRRSADAASQEASIGPAQVDPGGYYAGDLLQGTGQIVGIVGPEVFRSPPSSAPTTAPPPPPRPVIIPTSGG